MTRVLCAAMLAVVLGWMAPASADQGDNRLSPLFDRLKSAPTEDIAKEVERQIVAIWNEPPGRDEDIDILMKQGMILLLIEDYPRALTVFDKVLARKPDYAEAWNKRATVNFMMDNYKASIEDIRRTLALEPRHFGALSGLGMIMMEHKDLDAALKAFEAALVINPYLGSARIHVEAIRKEMAGDPI